MTFEEAAAKRSVKALAATTDEELAADVRASVASVAAAWGIYRAVDDYPPRGTPARTSADGRGALIASVAADLAAMPADADLATVIALAQRVLGQTWPDRPAPAETVARVVDKLRYVAMVRPGQVRDARAVMGSASGA